MQSFMFWLILALVTLTLSTILILPLKLKSHVRGIAYLVVIFFCMGGYIYFGDYLGWQNEVRTVKNREMAKALLESEGGEDKIITALKKQLELHPSEAKGWYLLGRIYATKANWSLSFNAFEKACALEPDNELYLVNKAQAIWQLNNQHFNDELRALFKGLLAKNKQQPDALAMLAMDAYDRHEYQEAIGYWQALLRLVPPDSKEAVALKDAIMKASQEH